MSDSEGSAVADAAYDGAEAAEEVVDKTNGVEAVEAEGKTSMDDRKAKLDQLRKKMVRHIAILSTHVYLTVLYISSVLQRKPTERPSSRKRPGPRSMLARQQG